MTRRPRLAVIATAYGPQSHGVCIATKLLEGLDFADRHQAPRCDVVALHLLNHTDDDVGVATAQRHGVPVYHSVAAALCQGGDALDVDGVVIIGEHGPYPLNARGQRLYPRRELFDQVVGVFRQSNRAVPVFNDKHLSWNWAWAQHMWREAQALAVPFMAGSSLPYAPFEPAVELPRGRVLDDLVVVGYGGLEDYGVHALETMQFVIEQRSGGETGLSWVRCLSGSDVWREVDTGGWPEDLVDAAVHAGWLRGGALPHPQDAVHAFQLVYCDGQRALVLMADGYDPERGFGFATRYAGSGDVISAAYYLDPLPRARHFSAFVAAIEDMYLTGRSSAPVERALLTTGAMSHLIDSLQAGGAPVPTDSLGISYTPAPRPAAWRDVLR